MHTAHRNGEQSDFVLFCFNCAWPVNFSLLGGVLTGSLNITESLRCGQFNLFAKLIADISMTKCGVCQQEFPLLDADDQLCNKCRARKLNLQGSELEALNVLSILTLHHNNHPLDIESGPVCHLWYHDSPSDGINLSGLYRCIL